MLLASIAMLDAAFARWTFDFMSATLPIPLTPYDLGVDLFLAVLVVRDLATRGRLHPATLWGGLVLLAVQPLRLVVSGTAPWSAFAGWAVGLLGS